MTKRKTKKSSGVSAFQIFIVTMACMLVILLYALNNQRRKLESFSGELPKAELKYGPALFGFRPGTDYKDRPSSKGYVDILEFMEGKDYPTGSHAGLLEENYGIKMFRFMINTNLNVMVKASYVDNKLAKIIALCNKTNVKRYLTPDYSIIYITDMYFFARLREIPSHSFPMAEIRMDIFRVNDNDTDYWSDLDQYIKTKRAKKWVNDVNLYREYILIEYSDANLAKELRTRLSKYKDDVGTN